MRAKSLRNINVSETVYSGAGEDGKLFGRPDIDEEFIDQLKNLVNCDQDKKESCFLIIALTFLILYSFNLLLSLLALYETNYKTVSKKCPETLIWYYLLSSVTILNFIYYLSFKGFNLINNSELIKYLYTVLFLVNSLFGITGYLILDDTCINVHIGDSKLVKFSYYNNYSQLSILVLSIITPVYLYLKKRKKNTNKCKEINQDNNNNNEIEINTSISEKNKNINIEIKEI